MRPRDREIEVDESRVTIGLVVALVVGGGIFYSGLWVGGWLAHGASGLPAQSPSNPSRPGLPPGFIGPPLPPYPPPVAGRPGAGQLGSVAVTLEDYTDRVEAEHALRELLASGYPAYLVGTGQDRWQLRVGDYGTLAEAESVRSRLSAAGTTARGLLQF